MPPRKQPAPMRPRTKGGVSEHRIAEVREAMERLGKPASIDDIRREIRREKSLERPGVKLPLPNWDTTHAALAVLVAEGLAGQPSISRYGLVNVAESEADQDRLVR